MKRFNDSTGKQWEFDVNVESLERVKAIHGIDLTQLFDKESKVLTQLLGAPAMLSAVLWCLIGLPDGDAAAFMRAMKGDALQSATNALVDDVIDFFPSPHQRTLCRNMVRKMWEITDAEVALAEARLAAIDTTSLNSATNSAQSLVSSPAG